MKKTILGVFLLVATWSQVRAQDYEYPFQNPDLSIQQRVDNIISLMTLEEKISVLGTDPDVPRLGIEGAGHLEGYHGLAMGGPANWTPEVPIPTTQFPQAVGMGETWDPDLIRQAGRVEGTEARYIYQSDEYSDYDAGLVIRAPNADLARDIRWGRAEESFGEDPYLVGTMSAAFARGLQGDDPNYWLTASLMKHFLANSNEDTRSHSSSNFDHRLLREYYAVPFRMGAEQGGANSYMAAYNAYNEIPMTVHPIIEGITKKEWGIDGIICTDASAMSLMVSDHKYFPDTTMAAAATVKAGINQFLDRYDEPVHKALNQGLLTEEDIDRVIGGSFRTMIKLGLLDPDDRVPYSDLGSGPKPWTTEEHKELALKAAHESIVLLKNEHNFLPLDKSKKQTIALIGPWADKVLLDWYSGQPPYRITPLDGIKKKVDGHAEVLFSTGEDVDEAREMAEKADVVIAVMGNHPTGDAEGWAEVAEPSYGREAVDRKSITLEQEDLVKQLYRANPNTMLVLKSSFPYAINWSQQYLPAIVHMAHNSQEEGTALADVLFGDYNPGGRLVHTWPRSLDQLPPLMDYNIRHGRTYMYFDGNPLYPFGYGLSYTTFEYSGLKLSTGKLDKEGEMTISFEVTNTGDRAGDEVAQLYIKHLHSTVKRADKELKGFKRFHLDAGETKTVELPLKGSDLKYWNEKRQRFEVEKDDVKIMVGASSSHIELTDVIEVQ